LKKFISIVLAVLMISGLAAAYAEDGGKLTQQQEAREMSFTVEEAVQYALDHNRDIKIQDINIEKADIGFDKTIFETNKYADYEIVQKKLKQLGVQRRAGKLQTNIAHWNKQITINEIEYNVTKEYYELYKAAEMVSIAEEGLSLAKNVYEQSVLKHKLGTISSQQLLFSETELKQAESNLDKAKLGYELQKMTFNDELGLPLTTDIQLKSQIDYKKHDEINIENAVKEGLENNVMLKALQEDYEISKLTLEAISVKYPSNTFNYKEQDVKIEEALKNLEKSKNAVEFQIRSSYLIAETEEKQIDTYNKSVEKAENIYKLTLLSYDVGESTVNDVASSRINLMNSKIELLNEIHSYNIAMLDFDYSKGIGKTKLN
jgi:outer membrane protein TolC